VGAPLEITVHECRRGGVACCRDWSEAGHVLAELGDEMRWIHWFGGQLVAHRVFLEVRRTRARLPMLVDPLCTPCGARCVAASWLSCCPAEWVAATG
jgi:hypothetical protein